MGGRRGKPFCLERSCEALVGGSAPPSVIGEPTGSRCADDRRYDNGIPEEPQIDCRATVVSVSAQ